MPLAFPSHQGLLAPLWRRWPRTVLPLWVGAAVPDPIDGLWRFCSRGTFGQGFAHSLLGAVAAGVPAGLLLLAALRRLVGRWRQRGAGWRRCLGEYLAAIDGRGGAARDGAGLAIGAVSHVLFDLVSHERARLLWPFAADPDWFGSWWRTVWFRVSAPGYPDYPIGPHFVAWLGLSLVGAWLFLRCRPRADALNRPSCRPPGPPTDRPRDR